MCYDSLPPPFTSGFCSVSKMLSHVAPEKFCHVISHIIMVMTQTWLRDRWASPWLSIKESTYDAGDLV